MSLAGKDAQIYLTGTSTSMTDESMTDAGDTTTYQIDDSAKDVFDPSVTFTVSDGGGTVAASNYTIRYLVGVVEFDTAPTDPVTIDGSYLPKYTVLEGYEQSVEYAKDLYDTTRFQDDGMRRGSEGPLDVTGDFSLHQAIERELDSDGGTEATIREILLGEETHGGAGSIDQTVVYRAQPNDAATDTLVSAFVKFTDESTEASVGSEQSRSYSFEADRQSAAMSSQTAQVADIFSNSEI